MIVTVDRLRRPFATVTFDDITSKRVVGSGWDEQGRFGVQFAVNLTAAEAASVELRLSTQGGVEETLQTRAWDATAALLAYESEPTPTQVQTMVVVKLLCRVVRALVRLQLGRTDTAGDDGAVSPPASSGGGKARARG